MAVMLRSIGIPARVAVGFTAGTFDDDPTAVRVTTERRPRLGRGAVPRLRLAHLRTHAEPARTPPPTPYTTPRSAMPAGQDGDCIAAGEPAGRRRGRERRGASRRALRDHRRAPGGCPTGGSLPTRAGVPSIRTSPCPSRHAASPSGRRHSWPCCWWLLVRRDGSRRCGRWRRRRRGCAGHPTSHGRSSWPRTTCSRSAPRDLGHPRARADARGVPGADPCRRGDARRTDTWIGSRRSPTAAYAPADPQPPTRRGGHAGRGFGAEGAPERTPFGAADRGQYRSAGRAARRPQQPVAVWTAASRRARTNFSRSSLNWRDVGLDAGGDVVDRHEERHLPFAERVDHLAVAPADLEDALPVGDELAPRTDAGPCRPSCSGTPTRVGRAAASCRRRAATSRRAARPDRGTNRAAEHRGVRRCPARWVHQPDLVPVPELS